MIPTICLITLILLIFFRTDAWIEYCRLFHLNIISFYKDFDIKYKEDVSLTYITYLRRYHDCFFVRLITCPICLAVWLGIIFSLFTSITFLPLYIIGGLLLFTIIDRLLG
jgi:hypothetical protein